MLQTHKYRPTRQGTCDECGRSPRAATHQAPAPKCISQQWSIRPTGLRTARLEAAKLTLHASNGRVQAEGEWLPDRYGPVRWLVAHDERGTVATGAVWQGTEYQALVRQAMLEAERAAAGLIEVARIAGLPAAEARARETNRSMRAAGEAVRRAARQ